MRKFKIGESAKTSLDIEAETVTVRGTIIIVKSKNMFTVRQ